MRERVLVTGACGFIGHHVVEHLLRTTDWDVVCLENLTYAASANRLTSMHDWDVHADRVRFVFHNLQAPVGPVQCRLIGRLDYILHLAAESHVDRSLQREHEDTAVLSNVLGALHVLRFAKDLGVRKMIQISTDEVYGPAPAGVLYKEWDRTCPSNTYAATKVGADALAMAFARAHAVPVIISRTMNNFGERQFPEKLLPKALQRIFLGQRISIHSDLSHLGVTEYVGDDARVPDERIGCRTWLHARNHADALLFLLRHETDPGDIFNVSGNIELNNRELCRLVARAAGRPAQFEYVDFHRARPGHDMRYGLDGTRLHTMGWRPPVDFSASLERTVAWYMANPDWLGILGEAENLVVA